MIFFWLKLLFWFKLLKSFKLISSIIIPYVLEEKYHKLNKIRMLTNLPITDDNNDTLVNIRLIAKLNTELSSVILPHGMILDDCTAIQSAGYANFYPNQSPPNQPITSKNTLRIKTNQLNNYSCDKQPNLIKQKSPHYKEIHISGLKMIKVKKNSSLGINYDPNIFKL